MRLWRDLEDKSTKKRAATWKSARTAIRSLRGRQKLLGHRGSITRFSRRSSARRRLRAARRRPRKRLRPSPQKQHSQSRARTMNPWKPWFIYRPSQIIRRLTFRSTSSYRPLEVAWGGTVLALDDEHIGRCLGTTGIYDSQCRTVFAYPPGDSRRRRARTSGTGLLAATAGARVIALEPNPALLPIFTKRRHSRRCGAALVLAVTRRCSSHPIHCPNMALTARYEAEPGAVPVQVETLGELLAFCGCLRCVKARHTRCSRAPQLVEGAADSPHHFRRSSRRAQRRDDAPRRLWIRDLFDWMDTLGPCARRRSRGVDAYSV